MSTRKHFPTNRKRIEDYYGVHDTGMGAAQPPPPPPPRAAPSRVTPPPPAPPPPAPPPSDPPPSGPAAPADAPGADAADAQGAGAPVPPGTVPPGTVPTGPDGALPDEPLVAHLVDDAEPRPQQAPRPKRDPLTDPLTSETFQGVQPEPDTFPSSLIGNFGYSSDSAPGSTEPSYTSFDQFAPPKFEPRAENTWTDPEPGTATATPGADPDPRVDDPHPDAPHPDGYLDVEVVDVVEVQHQTPVRETLAIDAFPYTQIDESYVDPATLPEPKEPGDVTDFNESLKEAMAIEGALGVALVDAQSGMTLATAGDPAGFNLEVAAAGNSALVQAMGRTLGDLDLEDHIEDILITLGSQYQIVRPIRRGADNLFLYLVLDRARANLAMARFRLAKLEEAIEV